MSRSALWYSGGAFTPASLSPTLWLQSEGPFWQDTARTIPATADTDPIGSWQDTSGTGSHAIQATAGSRPQLKKAITNSKDVARFDGTDDILVAPITARAAQTVFLVVQKRTAVGAASSTPLSINTVPSGTGGFLQIFSASGNGTGYNFYRTEAGAVAVIGGTPTAWTIIEVSFVSLSSVVVRIGGGAGVTVDPHDAYASGVQLGLGGSSDATPINFSNSDIAEAVRYASSLSLADVNLVGTYLASKFAATWTTAT